MLSLTQQMLRLFSIVCPNLKNILKKGDVTAFVAMTILNEVKREIESEAVGKKL